MKSYISIKKSFNLHRAALRKQNKLYFMASITVLLHTSFLVRYHLINPYIIVLVQIVVLNLNNFGTNSILKHHVEQNVYLLMNEYKVLFLLIRKFL